MSDKDIVICCSGLSPSERDNIYELAAKELCLKTSRNLTNKVTHLICRGYSIGSSAKYKAAIKVGIKLMDPSWIYHTCSEVKNGSRSPTECLFKCASNFVLKPLAGMVICTSNFNSSQTRKDLESKIIENGAIYSADLTRACTALVVPSKADVFPSSKVLAAISWNITIVPLSWLEDSMANGYVVDFGKEDYKIEVGVFEKLSVEAKNSNYSQESIRMTQFDPLLGENVDPDTTRLNLPDEDGLMVGPPSSFLDGCHFFLSSNIVNSSDLTHTLKKLITEEGGIRISSPSHFLKISQSESAFYVVDAAFEQSLLHTIEADLCISLKRANIDFSIIKHSWLTDSSKAMIKLPLESYKLDLEKIIEASSAAAQKALYDNKDVKCALNQVPSNPFLKAKADETIDTTTILQSKNLGLFSETKFMIQNGFTSSKMKLLIGKIEKNGGTIVSNTLGESYNLKALEKRSVYSVSIRVNSLKSYQRSEFWIERCLHENKLVEFNSLFLYRVPLFELPLKGFQSIKIAITGFTPIEREHIGKLCSFLGATFSEQFSKKYNVLICAELKGTKFDKAIEWKIPTVSVEWINACAENGKLIAFEKFTFVSSKNSLDSKVVFPKLNNEKILSNLTPILETAKVKNNFESGQVGSTPLNLKFKKNLKLVLEKTNLTKNNSNDDKKQILKECNTINNPILCDCVLYISGRLWHRKQEYHSLIQKMSGSVTWTLSRSVTHFVHYGSKETEMFKDFITARSRGIMIVSPLWLIQCFEQQKRLPETKFPHTLPLTVPHTNDQNNLKRTLIASENVTENNESEKENVSLSENTNSTLSTAICKKSKKIFSLELHSDEELDEGPGTKHHHSANESIDGSSFIKYDLSIINN